MGLCVVQADCCGGLQSKNYYVPLWVDAAEPAYRSRLLLGRSPACTHLSPRRQKHSQKAQVNTDLSLFQQKGLILKVHTDKTKRVCISPTISWFSVQYLCFLIYTPPEGSLCTTTTKLDMIMYVVFVNSIIYTFISQMPCDSNAVSTKGHG